MILDEPTGKAAVSMAAAISSLVLAVATVAMKLPYFTKLASVSVDLLQNPHCFPGLA